MKKLFFAFPIVALLGAGCNSSQQVSIQPSVQTPIAENANPTSNQVPATQTTSPSPTPTPSPTTSQITEWKTVTNDTLHFSVSIPTDYNMLVNTGNPNEPVYNRYGIYNAANNGNPEKSIYIQMQPGWTTDLAKDLPDYFSSPSDFNPSFIKPFQSQSGLTGIIYSDPNKFIEEVLILYPASLQSKVQPVHLPKVADPLIDISMDGYMAFTAQQNQLFMEVANSLQFTN